MSSNIDDASDESDDQFEVVDKDEHSSPECDIMSNSDSDNDFNEESPFVNSSKDTTRHSIIVDSYSNRSFDQHSVSFNSDTDQQLSDRSESFNYFPGKELQRKKDYPDFYSRESLKRQGDNELSGSNFKGYSEESSSSGKRKKNKDSDNYGGNKRKRSESPELSSSSYLSSSSLIPSANSLNKPYESGFGSKLLKKMGHVSGEGLGKYGQGRVDPVELSKQKGRKGLGSGIPNIGAARENWDPSLEDMEVMKEKVDWLEASSVRSSINYESLIDWMEEGPKNLNISEMTDFCDADLLNKVISCKTVFDEMDNMDMVKARNRCNPFETIRKGIFQNRAAMKMANIDHAFDYMFTYPKHRDVNDTPMVKKNKLLYFADVCAGPGGFSEYILWRKKWRAKGIGFTLRGDNDFKLEDFKSGTPETFEPYYGPKDDGNITDSENITALSSFVREVTGEGVHFMMADGGFSVSGQECIQELLSKQLYLCQFLVALTILRKEGHFVCKLFDLFSPFSVGLVYLIHQCFYKICIFKPCTSRPANSERYIICKWFRGYDYCKGVIKYLFKINDTLNELSSSDSSQDVISCVPLEVMQSDEDFYNYIYNSNKELAERQIYGLAKISAYYEDSTLVELRQAPLRAKCLSLWKVPDALPKYYPHTPEDALKQLFKKKDDLEQLLNYTPTELKSNMNSIFSNIYDWETIVLGNEDHEVCLYLGMGRTRISKYHKQRWESVDSSFELSPGTLVLAEKVTEHIEHGRKPRKCNALHIIDAYSLGYDCIISMEPYSKRVEMCELYVSALNKRSSFFNPVRVIKSTPLERIAHIFDCVEEKYVGREGNQLTVSIDNYFYSPKGILFFKSVKDPWIKCKSKSSGLIYYYSRTENKCDKACKTSDGKVCDGKCKKVETFSFYEQERPILSVEGFKDSLNSSIIWKWELGVGLKNEGERDGVLHKDSLISYVEEKKRK